MRITLNLAGHVLFLGLIASLMAAENSELLTKHDANRNGKIDVEERKEYVKEVSRLRRAEERKAAALMPKLKPGENLRIDPRRWTPEKIKIYDANKNSKLDPEERAKERHDAVEYARTEKRKQDLNGDGKVDPHERAKAVREAKPEKPAPAPTVEAR